jgi:HEAT repeat protein
LPYYYQTSLITRFFNILDKEKKSLLIETLLFDLTNSENCDIKRFLINILGNFNDTRVFQALLNFITDDDWLTRFYTVKSISKLDYNDLKFHFEKQLQNLLHDNDPDVRAAVKYLLNKIS